MATNQHITPPPSGASAKNSAARVAAEKARLAKAPPKAAKVKTTKRAPASGVNDQQRYEMIAEAAYFRAADRDFAPGHEVDDWVAAEQEIDLMLK